MGSAAVIKGDLTLDLRVDVLFGNSFNLLVCVGILGKVSGISVGICIDVAEALTGNDTTFPVIGEGNGIIGISSLFILTPSI